MKYARVCDASGQAAWVLLDDNDQCGRRIGAPFAVWADRVATEGHGALDLDDDIVDLSDLRLLSPVEPGARIFGVGLNYLSHLSRLGTRDAPAHSIGYLKPQSALVEPGGEIVYPAVTSQLDYEIELVAVVARSPAMADDATECLLGYTVGNDISARDAGKAIGRLDLFTQKALDRTAPVGPWIASLDACGGAGQPALDMTLSVDGVVRQHDNTANMIFSVAELLDFIDARVALRPGDILFTGSTCGVGLEDGRFLQPGNRIEARIDGIGTLCNSVGPKRKLAPQRCRGRLGIP